MVPLLNTFILENNKLQFNMGLIVTVIDFDNNEYKLICNSIRFYLLTMKINFRTILFSEIHIRTTDVLKRIRMECVNCVSVIKVVSEIGVPTSNSSLIRCNNISIYAVGVDPISFLYSYRLSSRLNGILEALTPHNLGERQL